VKNGSTQQPYVALKCWHRAVPSRQRSSTTVAHSKDLSSTKSTKAWRAALVFSHHASQKKRSSKTVTTLVPHRTSQLADLLSQVGNTCEVAPLRRFLGAGGLPDALAELEYLNGTSMSAPLIFTAIATHRMAQNPAFHHESMTVLLEAGANADAVTVTPDGRASTALMAACAAPCCTAPVRILLAHKANPCLQTAEGKTALHSAARAGRIDLCKLLLEAGGGGGLDVSDCLGCTPLAEAVRGGHLHAVEMLHKQCGATLKMNSPKDVTVLHLAAESGQGPILEYLLHNGAHVNAPTRGSRVTPVCIAAIHGNAAAVQILLDHGASNTVVDADGDSLRCAAVRWGHARVVELLLSSRNSSQPVGDVNTPAVNGSMPLLVAAACASAELVQVLLDAGADTTAR
jgi:ankyrin repeat protein